MIKKTLLLLLPFISSLAIGNGLVISNLTVNDTHTQATFDISWENSWRQTERFHDAVWVYIKYRPDNSIQWEHASISGGTGSGNLELVSQSDEMGIFIRNTSDFTGNVPATSITLDIAVDSTIAIYPDFEVYGIEMVYIPEGPYYFGDRTNSNISVKSSGEYGLDESPPYLFYEFGKNYYETYVYDSLQFVYNTPNETIKLTNKFYPTGYNAFYCMKYPFTQQQVVDYLNHLNQEERINFGTNSAIKLMTAFHRNGIYSTDSILNSGSHWAVNDLDEDGIYNEANDGATLANAFHIDKGSTDAPDTVNYEFFYTLLNWTGLRPMSELEFEKACRGPLAPIASEQAWGTKGRLSAFSIINEGTENETVDRLGEINLLEKNIYRVGYLSSTGFTRLQSHAGYYGVLDLSTNGIPLLISITNENFTGKLGNGSSGSRPIEWGDAFHVVTRSSVSERFYAFDETTGKYSGDLAIGGRPFTGRGVRQP